MDLGLLKSYALSFLGVPYRYGGRNRLEGLDCSQLVIELLTAAGVLPYGFDTTAQGLYDRFASTQAIQNPGLGDLAFYGKTTNQISHVAFCLDAETMIEAGAGDASVIDLHTAIEKSAVVRMRLIRFRKDLVSLVSIRYPV